MKYKTAGVDVVENDYLTTQYKKIATRATRPEVVSGVGLFSGAFDARAYKNHLLISSTDGVGTKTMIARVMNQFETIGADIVNHSINDILTSGAEPLFFLDYLATGGISPKQKLTIVKSVATACRKNNIALLGGETADMPDLYPKNEFDLAGTIIGAVKKTNLITGQNIATGDQLVALPSTGLHTNGYSLVRHIFKLNKQHTLLAKQKILSKHYPELKTTLGKALLVPHKSYEQELRPHLKHTKGLAHITGGGIAGNLQRILPQKVCAVVQRNAWLTPPLFQLIQTQGKISTQEMYRVFNMGVGMIAVVAPKNADELLKNIKHSCVIGEITPRKKLSKRVTLV